MPFQVFAAEMRCESDRPRAGVADDENFRMAVEPRVDITGPLQRPQHGGKSDLFGRRHDLAGKDQHAVAFQRSLDRLDRVTVGHVPHIHTGDDRAQRTADRRDFGGGHPSASRSAAVWFVAASCRKRRSVWVVTKRTPLRMNST